MAEIGDSTEAVEVVASQGAVALASAPFGASQ